METIEKVLLHNLCPTKSLGNTAYFLDIQSTLNALREGKDMRGDCQRIY